MVEKHNISRIMLVIAAVLWSLSGLFVKQTSWSPSALAGVRSGIAAVILLSATRKLKFSRDPYFIGAICSFTLLGFCFIFSTRLTTAANAILLQYIAPVYVALIAYFFLREVLHWYDLIATFGVLIGLALFFLGEGGDGHLLGIIIGIGSGIAFAVFIVCSRHTAIHPINAVIWGNLVTCFLTAPFWRAGITGWDGFLPVFFSGFLSLGIAYLIYTSAVKNVTTMEGVIIPAIEPVLNPLIVFFVIAEIPDPKTILGGLFILMAVIFHSYVSNQRMTKPRLDSLS